MILCADPSGTCPAVVTRAGEKCPVHRHAQQGPYSTPCEKCGHPITKHDLFVRAVDPDRPSDQTRRPWHYQCRPGAPTKTKTKRQKRGWDSGLGRFAQEAP